MDHSHHEHHKHNEEHHAKAQSNFKLATSATTHCLVGCGIGEVFGVIVGTFLGLSYYPSLVVGVLAGFVFGFALGILPLLKAKMTLAHAIKIVITTEFLSIAVMETAEVLTELHFPGMRYSTLGQSIFWTGLFAALVVGFIAAFPVNLYLVGKGVRHQH